MQQLVLNRSNVLIIKLGGANKAVAFVYQNLPNFCREKVMLYLYVYTLS